jgi:heterotetrameric sarcosine oxidase gamma subunit
VSDVGPLARSPVPVGEPAGIAHGWQISARRSHADLRLADSTASVKALVRAEPRGAMAERLGVRVGHAVRTGEPFAEPGSAKRAEDLRPQDVLMCRFGPGEWLAMATLDRRASMWGHLRTLAADADDLVSLIDVTHGRVVLRLTGARAAITLSKICGIDLRDDVTPDGAALRTSVAALVTDIVRNDVDGQRSYLLGCEWSSGQYLWDAVLEAGAEFGIDVDGLDGTRGI